LGAPRAIQASLAPKSATAPIAMSLAEKNGGIPTLMAALVIATGIFGAVTVTPLMNHQLQEFRHRALCLSRVTCPCIVSSQIDIR